MIEQLYKNHSKWLSSANSLLKNKQDAEDLVQDMYIKLYHKENINSTYVYMTIRSMFLDIKKKDKNITMVDIEKVEPYLESEQININKQNYEELRQNAFKRMKPYERIILHYSYKDGLRKFSRETGISTHIIQNVRNKFKQIIWEEKEKIQD